MKFFTDNLLLIGLAIGSGAMLIWPLIMRSASGSSILSASQAVLLINRENAVVVDVRDDTEFASGHIADAKHIPLAQLPDRLAQLGQYKDKPLLLNCQTGVRSTKAGDILRKNAFSKVYHLDGGINAWVEAKLPVVKS